MTVVISFASIDGYVSSLGGTYSTAVGSGTRAASTTSDRHYWGQQYVGGAYRAFESFLSFPYTLDTTRLIPAAYFEVTAAGTNNTGVTREFRVYEYDWGASLETADWRTPTQLRALPLMGASDFGEEAAAGQAIRAGAASLVSRLNKTTGAVRVVVASDRLADQITPTVDESSSFWSAEASGTANDPRLVYSYVRRSTLNRISAAQVMLQDGSQAYLEYTGSDPSAETVNGTVKLMRRTVAGSTTVLGSIVMGNTTGNFAEGLIGGQQSFALCRDDDENLYVIGRDRNQNVVAGQCWAKGSGYTWAAKTRLEQSIPVYQYAYFDFYAATWHAAGGAAGTMLAMVAAPPASGRGGVSGGVDQQFQLLYINCDSLKAGSGSLLRGTGKYTDLFNNGNPSGHSWFYNPWGIGFDLVATSSTRGYAISYNADDMTSGDPAVSRYTLNSNGIGFANVAKSQQSIGATPDSAGKLRVVRISDSLFCVTGGNTAFLLLQSIGSGSVSAVAKVSVADLGLASMPTSLTGENGWDTMYDPTSNRVYLYYFKVGDTRSLMRTSFDVTNLVPSGEEVTVSSAVGVSGSSNLALRAHRGLIASGNKVMLTAANINGTVHSNVYVDDVLNAAPSAPVLIQRANFDAAFTSTFSWDFKDPNAGDTQSAYQLEITNAATGVVAFDSGKTASTAEQRNLAANTLTNGNSYTWRVRTWDALDAVGPWSSSLGFVTAVGGGLTITSPMADNPPDLDTDEFPITWSVSGSTQAAYRVRVVRTDTGAQVSDTGWVTSTTTTHTVTGMLSDLEYGVYVTVRDSVAVESNTELRLLTPSYGRPEVPSLQVTATDGGYARVVISNPLPGQQDTGMEPNGFEDAAELAQYAYSGATLAVTTDNAFTGSSSALITAAGTVPVVFRRAAANRISVTGGVRYKLQFQAYAPVAITNLWRVIDWYDADGVLIRGDGSTVPVEAGVWTEQAIVYTAPDNAVTAGFGFDVGTTSGPPPAGRQLYVDQMVLLGATDRPDAIINELYRRVAGRTGPYRRLGTVSRSGEFQDYEAAGGRTYEYVVRAIASNGGYTDSIPLVVKIGLLGVWIHDPQDPAGTIRNYPYGKSNRSRQIDVSQSGSVYAGRRYPVVDYGEQQTDSLSITVVVPTGDDWLNNLTDLQEFAGVRRTLCFRDNRGRTLFGTMSGYRESDEDVGTVVSFTVDRVDYSFTEKWVSL